MALQNPQKILVVDDEESIRELVSDFLTNEGYSVTTAENGIAALGELQRDSYDLLITDLVMPKMGGVELLDWLWEKELKINTLIITGSPLDDIAEYLKYRGALACIPKPFPLNHLSHMVQKGLTQV